MTCNAAAGWYPLGAPVHVEAVQVMVHGGLRRSCAIWHGHAQWRRGAWQASAGGGGSALKLAFYVILAQGPCSSSLYRPKYVSVVLCKILVNHATPQHTRAGRGLAVHADRVCVGRMQCGTAHMHVAAPCASAAGLSQAMIGPRSCREEPPQLWVRCHFALAVAPGPCRTLPGRRVIACPGPPRAVTVRAGLGPAQGCQADCYTRRGCSGLQLRHLSMPVGCLRSAGCCCRGGWHATTAFSAAVRACLLLRGAL